VSKNREASHYSLTIILVRIVDDEDWIAKWVVQKRASERRGQGDRGQYRSLRQVRRHLDDVEERAKSCLAGADGNRQEGRSR